MKILILNLSVLFMSCICSYTHPEDMEKCNELCAPNGGCKQYKQTYITSCSEAPDSRRFYCKNGAEFGYEGKRGK